MSRELTIDPEFRDILDQLTTDENETLRELILESPPTLTYWRPNGNGEAVLIDGHHSYKICQEEAIEPVLKERHFKDREAVITFIRKLHLGRRNMTDERKSFHRGKAYANAKPSRGGDQSLTNERLLSAEKMAEKEGVSVATIRRDAEFADAVDTVGETSKELKAAALAGELTKEETKRLAKLPKDKRLALVGKPIDEIRKALPKATKPKPSKNGKHSTEPSEDNPLVDKIGQDIPKNLRDAFEDRSLTDCISQITQATKLFKSAHNWNVWIDLETVVDSSSRLRLAVEQNIPYAIHAKCGGKGCKVCRNMGYVPEWRYLEMTTHKEFA